MLRRSPTFFGDLNCSDETVFAELGGAALVNGIFERQHNQKELITVDSPYGLNDISEFTEDGASVTRRKTKRFRLTSAQAQYLKNEFTHQAHPDATQGEKLSQNIPGLSPRQVQVWFQNQRALAKRLRPGTSLRPKQPAKQREEQTIKCNAEQLASFSKTHEVNNDWEWSIPEKVIQVEYPSLLSASAVNVQGFAQDSIPIDFGGGPSAMNVEIAQDLGNPSTFGPDTEDLLLMKGGLCTAISFYTTANQSR